MSSCIHKSTSCLNQFELIRKYRCAACSGVMMCDCEKEFATRYLSHQIRYATDSDTQQEVKVTLGFQKNICNACRGLPVEAHPAAPIPGRTSKIARYYWREIAFETIPRFAEWAKEQSYSDWLDALLTHKDKHRSFEKDVINEMKELHERSPKYIYQDIPQSEILAQYNVEVVRLNGIYVKDVERHALIVDGTTACSPEEFVSRHFQRQGYDCFLTESRPFHVLFGTFMWMLIEDADDPSVRLVGFGRRDALTEQGPTEVLWTLLHQTSAREPTQDEEAKLSLSIFLPYLTIKTTSYGYSTIG